MFKYVNGTVVRELKGHRLTVTCVAVSNNGKYLFSGSKDGSIIKCNPFMFNYSLFYFYFFYIFLKLKGISKLG